MLATLDIPPATTDVERLRWVRMPDTLMEKSHWLVAWAGPDLWDIRVFRNNWSSQTHRHYMDLLWRLKHKREYQRYKAKACTHPCSPGLRARAGLELGARR